MRWVMCSTLPVFFAKNWRVRLYVLWKSARKGLILRNTGFIITGTIICLYVERRQVIGEFITSSWFLRDELVLGGSLEGAGVQRSRCFSICRITCFGDDILIMR